MAPPNEKNHASPRVALEGPAVAVRSPAMLTTNHLREISKRLLAMYLEDSSAYNVVETIAFMLESYADTVDSEERKQVEASRNHMLNDSRLWE